MATGGEIQITEEGRCSICLQILKEPTTLPCQHTFCKKCISQFFFSNGNNTKAEREFFSCPVCMTDLTCHRDELSKLGIDTTSAEIKETRDKFNCVPCKNKGKDTPATNWCRDCREKICKTCQIDHDSFSFMKSHKVSPLEEIRGPKDVEFLGEYSDKCPAHPERIAEAYCFDHGQLCCVLCVTRTHQKCENARAICDREDFPHKTFETDLSKIQIATTELLQEKQEDKRKVEQSFLDIEESVNSTVLKIKDNLDMLMISFRKELHFKQDEYESKIDPIIKELETFRETVAKTIENVQFVRNYGTQTQLFNHIEKTKDEIKTAIEETIRPLLSVRKLGSRLVLQNVVQQIEKLPSLGQVEISEEDDLDMLTFKDQVNDFCNLNACFKSIKIETETSRRSEKERRISEKERRISEKERRKNERIERKKNTENHVNIIGE